MIRLLIPVPYLARYHAVTYTRSLTLIGRQGEVVIRGPIGEDQAQF